MKKATCLSFLLLIVFLFSACAMPSTTVRTVDDRPTLAIKGAPDGAVLFVDGLDMGFANKYNGDPTALTVESGTHSVRIVINNTSIYEQKVFVEDSLKTITIR